MRLDVGFYHTPPAATRASGDPEPLSDLLDQVLDELRRRLERRPGMAYLVRRALGLRAAGCPGFVDVPRLELVAELLGLGRDDPDDVIHDRYGTPGEEVRP